MFHTSLAAESPVVFTGALTVKSDGEGFLGSKDDTPGIESWSLFSHR